MNTLVIAGRVLYGGRILAADRSLKPVEGRPLPVIVIVEFESVEVAQRWYDSLENTAVKGHRTSTTEGWLAIADGSETLAE